MSQQDAITALIEQARQRERRLRTLAGDPYAGGTELFDADLIRDLADHLAALMPQVPQQETEEQDKSLRAGSGVADSHGSNTQWSES